MMFYIDTMSSELGYQKTTSHSLNMTIGKTKLLSMERALKTELVGIFVECLVYISDDDSPLE